MISVEKMANSDIDRVLEIERNCFGFGWTSTPFEKELDRKDCSYYVAKDNGVAIGYGGAWLILEELHIIIIAVDPDYRQKRIGQRILVSLLRDSIKNGAKWSTLEVKANNIPAQRMYEKFGYSVKGVRKRYYHQDGQDALIMWTEEIDNQNYLDFLEVVEKEIISK